MGTWLEVSGGGCFEGGKGGMQGLPQQVLFQQVGEYGTGTVFPKRDSMGGVLLVVENEVEGMEQRGIPANGRVHLFHQQRLDLFPRFILHT